MVKLLVGLLILSNLLLYGVWRRWARYKNKVKRLREEIERRGEETERLRESTGSPGEETEKLREEVEELRQNCSILLDSYLNLREGVTSNWRVPPAELAQLSPIFADPQFGVSRECDTRIIGGAVVGGTSINESWILAVLAKRAKRLFEFGTCTGRTTYLWALNSPPDARITTITLRPDQVRDCEVSEGDHETDARYARNESIFTKFYYSGTDVEYKIEQLFGDSKQFDETPYLGKCDLIFIDGSHAYSFVVNDTRKAIRMLKPGGLLIWHDYRGERETRGVFRALNELVDTLPLFRIRETSFVFYRMEEARTTVTRDERTTFGLPLAWTDEPVCGSQPPTVTVD